MYRFSECTLLTALRFEFEGQIVSGVNWSEFRSTPKISEKISLYSKKYWSEFRSALLSAFRSALCSELNYQILNSVIFLTLYSISLMIFVIFMIIYKFNGKVLSFFVTQTITFINNCNIIFWHVQVGATLHRQN